MKAYKKDYPRPQLVRKEWTNLNGSWDFCFDDKNCGEKERWAENFPEEHQKIQVPFTYETKMSGIGDESHHSNIWYQRIVEVDAASLDGKKMLIHFEGSDYVTKLWVNGVYAGCHAGGYARFTFDITNYLNDGENVLTVKVEDSESLEQPRGKQRWGSKNFACWYVQTTGIWKTVWMELVPEVYIASMKLTPDMRNNSLDIEYEMNQQEIPEGYTIEAEISFDDHLINRSWKMVNRRSVKDSISVLQPAECQRSTAFGVHRWTTVNPQLYDLTVRVWKDGELTDEILSYFGLREIRIDNGNILLNGRPIYQRLILDQGYWEESHLTPPSEEALIDDIDKIHALGYNGLRKHMKIEDERFLYWCDVKGMLVWSEMAAAFEFSDVAVEQFTREWMEVVKQNYNHPCIITWTPFNESWGIPEVKVDKKQQAFTESIYYLTKSIDSMRPVIVNDGWEHTVSDILTLHDYEEDGDCFYERYFDHLDEIASCEIYHNPGKSAMADGYAYKGQPVIISEYGGIAFSGGKEGAWGYGNTVSTEEEFLKRFDKITTAIKKIPYVVGYCYTQVSDVQQEINGLLDGHHNYKVTPEKVKEINCREVGIRKINSKK